MQIEFPDFETYDAFTLAEIYSNIVFRIFSEISVEHQKQAKNNIYLLRIHTRKNLHAVLYCLVQK